MIRSSSESNEINTAAAAWLHQKFSEPYWTMNELFVLLRTKFDLREWVRLGLYRNEHDAIGMTTGLGNQTLSRFDPQIGDLVGEIEDRLRRGELEAWCRTEASKIPVRLPAPTWSDNYLHSRGGYSFYACTDRRLPFRRGGAHLRDSGLEVTCADRRDILRAWPEIERRLLQVPSVPGACGRNVVSKRKRGRPPVEKYAKDVKILEWVHQSLSSAELDRPTSLTAAIRLYLPEIPGAGTDDSKIRRIRRKYKRRYGVEPRT